MDRPIGYYVHHQGDGHRQRALAIARRAGGRITLLGSGLAGQCAGIEAIDLPDDRPSSGGFDANDGRVPRPDALHYAPIGHDGVRRRVARIADWIADARPSLMVVDVSVEVAMLARLASTPTVYVRLNGRRDDTPHREAFRAAAALLAPFARALDDDSTPEAVRAMTFYAPGLHATIPPSRGAEPSGVVGVIGAGGGAGDGERWAAAARAAPDVRWQVIGRCSAPADPPPNLERLGWVEDAPGRIAEAGIVVGAAGDGLVGSVIAARRPFVCIPETRPFGEQTGKAARLRAVGAAVVRDAWPAAHEWPALLAQARALDTSVLAGLDAADGAQRAADWLVDTAARCSREAR